MNIVDCIDSCFYEVRDLADKLMVSRDVYRQIVASEDYRIHLQCASDAMGMFFTFHGLEMFLSSEKDTCLLCLKDGNTIDIFKRLDDYLAEDTVKKIIITVEDLERIWYGGF